jgi:hypothetical protein
MLILSLLGVSSLVAVKKNEYPIQVFLGSGFGNEKYIVHPRFFFSKKKGKPQSVCFLKYLFSCSLKKTLDIGAWPLSVIL